MNQFKRLQEDLQLKKQLAEINNRAVKKLMSKEPPLPAVSISKDKRPSVERNTPQAISDLYMRDLAFQIRADNMTEQALDIKPYKVERAITQEMIDDYQAAPLVPVEIGGEKFKYNPSKIVLDLEELDLPHPEVPFREVNALKANAANLQNTINDDIAKLKRDKINAIIERRNLIKDYDETHSSIVDDIEAEEHRLKFNADRARLDDTLTRINAALKNAHNAFRELPALTDDERQMIEENQAEIRRVNDANKAAIFQYEQDLKALNPNLNISQGIGESDAEYAQRLQLTSNTTVSEQELNEAVNRKNYLEAKKNVGKLIKSGPQADVIVKSLDTDERFQFNKLAPIIIKDFLEIYGFDNKRVSDVEVTEFIRQSVNDPTAILTAKKLGPANEAPSTPSSSLLAAPLPRTAKGRLLQMANRVGLAMNEQSTIPDILDALHSKAVIIPDDVIELLRTVATVHKNRALKHNKDIKTGIAEQAEKEATKVGVGIRSYPKLVQFGKIFISGDELYYKNILKIRNSNQKAIIGFKNIKISDSLSSVLLKIIDGEKISKSGLSLLSDKERQIYDKVIQLSGLHKTHDNTFEKTAQELKETIATIRGEIEAGNNNPELLREAHTVLYNMAAIGLLNGNTAKKYYNELKSFF